MSGTPPIDSLDDKINRMGLKVGNMILASDGTEGTADSVPYIDSNKKLASNALTASQPLYIDSNKVPQSGSLPFAIPLAAGATDSGFSTLSISGRATGSADELMHLNLVAGANASATIAGYYRVTVTDAAGVITDGAYYAPFYVLN